MAAVDLLRVEPKVALVRFARERVVLHVAAADEDTQPARRAELARGDGLVAALLLLPAAAEIAGRLQFAAQLGKLRFGLRERDLALHALQIVALGNCLVDLLAQMLFGGLGLGVALIVLRRVLLRREQRIERNVDLRAVLVIIILRSQPRATALHAVEVCSDKIAVEPQRIALPRGGVLLFKHTELAHHALMRGVDRARQLASAALRGLLPVALGIEGVEQRGESREHRLLRFAPVLRDGTVGEVRRLALTREHSRCKVIFLHSACQRIYLRGKAFAACGIGPEAGVRRAEGTPGKLARDERRNAEVAVEQKAFDCLLRSPAAAGKLNRARRIVEQRQLPERRRELIEQPRQKRPRTGGLKLHAAHTV